MVDYKIQWFKIMPVPESRAVVGRHDGINGRDNLPASRTYNEDRLGPFSGHHADRRYEIGVVRYHDGSVEQLFPCVIQEMGRKIYVGAFFFHRMEFGDERIGQWAVALLRALRCG